MMEIRTHSSCDTKNVTSGRKQNLYTDPTGHTYESRRETSQVLEHKSNQLGNEWTVGPELHSEMAKSDPLKKSIERALRKLQSEFPEGKISAYVEHAQDAEEDPRVVIKIKERYNNVPEYAEIKERVREIVRNSEDDSVMTYTRIRRK